MTVKIIILFDYSFYTFYIFSYTFSLPSLFFSLAPSLSLSLSLSLTLPLILSVTHAPLVPMLVVVPVMAPAFVIPPPQYAI